MAYETAPNITGVIYHDDIIKTDYDDMLYESVDALILHIQSFPGNYGITDEVIKVGVKGTPNLYDEEGWRRHKHEDDIVVWTVCDTDNMTPEECESYCGGAMYEGKFWCQWHEVLNINYSYTSMATVIKR